MSARGRAPATIATAARVAELALTIETVVADAIEECEFIKALQPPGDNEDGSNPIAEALADLEATRLAMRLTLHELQEIRDTLAPE